MADTAAQQVEKIAALLIPRNERVAFAESCTGGLLSKLATDLAGSSVWFDRGLVTYSNDAKVDLLGVPKTIFETDGAVSESCVRAMARGLLLKSKADYGLAVTGIAGPGGGNPGRPVGTVWLAWVARAKEVRSEKFQFSGDRDAIRQQAASTALAGLLELIAG